MCDGRVVSLFSSQGGVSWWPSSHGHSSMQALPWEALVRRRAGMHLSGLFPPWVSLEQNWGCQVEQSWELDVSGSRSKSSDHRVCRAFTSTSSGQGGAPWAWLGSARVLQVKGYRVWNWLHKVPCSYHPPNEWVCLDPSCSQSAPPPAQLAKASTCPHFSRQAGFNSQPWSLLSIRPGLSCCIFQAIDKKPRLTNEFSIWPSCISY